MGLIAGQAPITRTKLSGDSRTRTSIRSHNPGQVTYIALTGDSLG
jgi:hypothetical protein